MLPGGIATGITNIILFLLVVLARRLISKESINRFLISKPHKRWKLFWEGCLMGFVLILVYVFLAVLFGVGQLSIKPQFSMNFIFILLSYIFAFAAVSLFEESLFRDYILLKFKKKYEAADAVFISSMIFALIHVFSYSSAGSLIVLGLLNAFIIGFILSLIVIATKSLMWPLGFHMMWNLTQTLFLMMRSGGINLEINEGILAGTSFIPEAGLIVTLILIGLIVYMVKRFSCAHIMPSSIGKG